VSRCRKAAGPYLGLLSDNGRKLVGRECGVNNNRDRRRDNLSGTRVVGRCLRFKKSCRGLGSYDFRLSTRARRVLYRIDMRYNDTPIDRPSLDLLGRAGFALALAHAIDELAIAKEGFVLAIQGEWGSGKTSLIRMICRYLRHIEMERASQTPFPWEAIAEPKNIEDLDTMAEVYERIEPLIEALDAFYRYKGVVRWTKRDSRWREIRRRLDSDEDTDTADRYWQLLERVEALPKTIVVHFSPWLISGRAELTSALITDLARILGDRLGEDIKRAFGELLKRMLELAPVVGTGLDMAAHGLGASALARVGRDSLGRVAEQMTSGPTLNELRDRVRNSLRELENVKFLVIIDDLDRLTPHEALELVSALKSLADLPNVVYLLSYDSRRLSELIRTAAHVNGHDFLDKIVQYSIVLPAPDVDDLSRMLDADVLSIFGTLSDDNKRRLELAWYYVFQHYLKTPRDVRRLANALAVAGAALRDYSDVVDLITLECLRLFEPDVYDYVRQHLNEFVG